MSKKQAINPKLYDVIQRPIITEKATIASEHGKVVFQVHPDASKTEVREAVEKLFGVKVTKVNTVSIHGKTKKFRGLNGKQNDRKKAIVTLAEGQTIDTMAGVN
ncbi:MAG: 50S ribosomal protein L23 [Rickettsiales bacterium]|nr:50S ribosomal protein L23 [Rickettsiales bacterium]